MVGEGDLGGGSLHLMEVRECWKLVLHWGRRPPFIASPLNGRWGRADSRSGTAARGDGTTAAAGNSGSTVFCSALKTDARGGTTAGPSGTTTRADMSQTYL